MDLFTVSSVIIVLSAIFGYVNVRFLKLPNTIGLMIIAIVFTLFIFASTLFTDRFLSLAEGLIALIDFEHVLLDVMLGFLLFAGAMHTNFDQLKVQRWPVMVFATLGILVSTFLCATLVYFVFRFLGLETKYIHCLLFGALISPTDPIAVLGILKKAKVPKKLETKIVGESLFNDGVGVVVFLTIMSIAMSGAGQGSQHESDPSHEHQQTSAHNEHADSTAEHEEAHSHHGEATVSGVVKLFGQEVLGGVLFGLVLGYVAFLLLKSIDDYEIEVLITLACVMGGYCFAHYLGLSAPLAIVVAGLFVGNDTMRGTSMSATTERYVDHFWELMDMVMNAILFVLIGLEILVLTFQRDYVVAAAFATVIVLASRFCSLLLPVRFFAKKLQFAPHTTTIMTWGGLRGGISIALALSLPKEMNRDLFLTVTYGVVVFSIIVQGLSVGMLAKRLIGPHAEAIDT